MFTHSLDRFTSDGPCQRRHRRRNKASPAATDRHLVCLSLSPGLPRWTTCEEGCARNFVTSVILASSVEGPRPEPSQSGRSEPSSVARAACFEQPEDVYCGCGDASPTKYTTCMASVFSVKRTVFGDGTVHDVLLAQFRAIHRTVDTLLQICVAIPRLSGAGIFKAPARATLSTSICRGTSTAR